MRTLSKPPHHYVWFWVPVTLAIGILAGGVIVAVFSGNTRAHPAAPRPTVTVVAPEPGGVTGSQAQVLIGGACLHALNDAQGAYGLLGNAGSALRHLDPGALASLISQAQNVRGKLARDLRGCNATVRLPSSSATPTPTPTG